VNVRDKGRTRHRRSIMVSERSPLTSGRLHRPPAQLTLDEFIGPPEITESDLAEMDSIAFGKELKRRLNG
jgi:hypothetical protein